LAVLAIVGNDVESRLSPTSLDIPGTSSSRATGVLREHFGDSAPFAILLRGPAAAIDRQASLAVIPWQMAILGRIYRMLPNALFDRMMAKAGRKPRKNAD
jgi:hypothetical protein